MGRSLNLFATALHFPPFDSMLESRHGRMDSTSVQTFFDSGVNRGAFAPIARRTLISSRCDRFLHLESLQLQRLCGLGITQSRRAGVNVHCRVVDLCVRSLLDQGLCLTEEAARRNLGER